MLPKFGKSKMSCTELTSTTRSALSLLVEREAKRTGSRTVAYETVGRAIGASSSWVRKFLARSEVVAEPRLTLFQNIRASYDILCSRVEQEHQNELRRIEALKGKLDAATSGIMPIAQSMDTKEVEGVEDVT